MRTGRRARRDGVWLVVDECDEPDEPVLGVFATPHESEGLPRRRRRSFPGAASFALCGCPAGSRADPGAD